MVLPSRLLLPLPCLALSLAGCTTLAERWSEDDAPPPAPSRFLRPTGGASHAPSPVAWWTAFSDPTLHSLMTRLEADNPDAAAALARVDQAYAALGLTGAARFPRLTGDASAIRQQDSLNALLFPIAEPQYERYRVAVNAQWELDLWGRLRTAYQRDKRRAQAAAEDYQDLLLSLQTTLARQYFALRFARRELAILQDALAIRSEALHLQEARVAEGAGVELDAARARTELESTRAQAEALHRTIGKLEHALATLTGRAPADFTPPSSSKPHALPSIPAGLPSDLLLRRPGLREAHLLLQAAARDAGITQVDFLPRIRLTGTGGVASLKTQTLFTSSDSFFFEFGPQIDIPLYQAGTRKASVARSQAQWREALENFRSQLLTAVQEVDDSLLDLQVLQRQIDAQRRALAAARETARLSRLRYDRGLVSYLEFVDAERSRLQNHQLENALLGEQTAATVQLIQALGGSWGPLTLPHP